MAKLINLMIFLCASLLLSSCISVKPDLTPFPPMPPKIEYKISAIIKRNADSTFVVSKEMIENSANDRTFVKEVLKWKERNGIE